MPRDAARYIYTRTHPPTHTHTGITYYAVNMYNEIRERRSEGGEKARVGGEEVEEEGRQTILAKDRRYSNAIVAAAAHRRPCVVRRNIFADYHGCRTTVIFFFLPR